VHNVLSLALFELNVEVVQRSRKRGRPVALEHAQPTPGRGELALDFGERSVCRRMLDGSLEGMPMGVRCFRGSRRAGQVSRRPIGERT